MRHQRAGAHIPCAGLIYVLVLSTGVATRGEPSAAFDSPEDWAARPGSPDAASPRSGRGDKSPVAYVDDDAPPGGDGLGWGTAFNLLRTALDATGGQGTIHIGAGTYYPDRIDPNLPHVGTGNRSASFSGSNLALIGGFAGYGASNPDENRPGLHRTILSGEIGQANDAGDNSYHVLSFTAGSPLIYGVTIRGGHANSSAQVEHRRGGGIYAACNDLVLVRCIIIDNCAKDAGGGIYFAGPSVPSSVFMLTNCVVAHNTATAGGGLFVDAPASTWYGNCVTIADNVALHGGGVSLAALGLGTSGPGTSSVLRNAIVWGNFAASNRSIEPPDTSMLFVEYVCIEGGWSGPGGPSFTADPLFESGGWRLSGYSPYLDIGFFLPDAGDLDVDGGPRVFDLPNVPNGSPWPVDFGAYERYPDCNGNYIDDPNDIAGCQGEPACSDCNANGVPDACDISSGFSDDADSDGIPDECDSSYSGACCVSGACEMRTAHDCALASGYWAGPGTSCDFDTCFEVACCFMPLGSCEMLPPFACVQEGGTPQDPNSTCATALCPVGTGACCTGDACVIMPADACAGAFLGFGASCDYPACRGACCDTDNFECVIVFEDQCNNFFGWQFFGIGTDCSGACLPPTGACCISFDCFDGYTELDCLFSGGSYQGDDTFCSAFLCGIPPWGACCIGTTCYDGYNADECDLDGGNYLGDGTDCADSPCATGACCLLGGECEERTVTSCGADGGYFLGLGVSCTAGICGPGACCFGLADSGCGQMDIANCISSQGYWLGSGTPCSPDPCYGACCVAGVCQMTGRRTCDLSGGTWQGPGSSCSPGMCVGACCVCADVCVETPNAAECAALAGTFSNFGAGCWVDVCSPATGACCDPLGSCAVLTAAECGNLGGTYQGDGTTCGSTTCGPLTGACCYPGGCQNDQTASECAAGSGTFYGPGTTCDPGTCRVGACCTAQVCQSVTESACSSGGGAFLGDGVQCNAIVCADCNGNSVPDALDISGGTSDDCNLNGVPDECDIASGSSQDANQNGIPDECDPPTTGACCLIDGSCGIQTASACNQANGTYQGDGSTCDPNPCPPAGACCGAAIVYGAQPATNLIVKLNPTTGEIVGGFAPPTAAAMQPAHVNVGLAMGEGVLYYVNTDAAPLTIFELDPVSGAAVRATRVAPPAPDDDHGERDIGVGNWLFGGLAYGAGRLFGNHGQIDLHKVELAGGEAYYWGASMQPTRAIGGDGPGRFFVRDTAGAIVELSAVSNVASTNAIPSPASDVEGLAFAGSTLYASTASGLLYRLDPNDGDVLSQITVPGGALFGLAVSGSLGECASLTQSACGQAGGTWQGAGTTCDDSDSDGVADLCEPPPPTGACCAASGSCSVITPNDCAAQSGVYRGDGTTCEPNPCPPPPPPIGACCATGGSCSVLTPSDCAAQSGAYRGDGTTCEPNPCPPPPGACCQPTGVCASAADAAACTALGGVFQGAGASCATIVCPVDPCTLDADGDGTNNCADGCPNDPAKTAPGACGCGVPDVNTDGDGAPDCADQCPGDPAKTTPGACGCGVPDVDTDGDGLLDCADNCPAVANADQADFDADGLGSACDSDEPGRPDPNLPASDFVRGFVDLLSGQATDADFQQNLNDLATTVDGLPGNRLEELDNSGRVLPDPNAAATAREIEDLAISLGICPAATAMILSIALFGALLVRRRQGP